MIRGSWIVSRGGGGLCHHHNKQKAFCISYTGDGSSYAPTDGGASSCGFSHRWHLWHCLGMLECLVFKVKMLLKGVNDLRTFRSEAQNQKKKQIVAPPKDISPLHCEDYSEGKMVIADSYQALLCQHLLPWISGTYPDVKFSSRTARVLLFLGLTLLSTGEMRFCRCIQPIWNPYRWRSTLWFTQYGFSEVNHLAGVDHLSEAMVQQNCLELRPTFKTIFWALNSEVEHFFIVQIYNKFPCMGLLLCPTEGG